MIDIISEVRNHPDNKNNPDLKDLNMRIGIHTGKVVAGIIGTNIVRYDIFGSDVLVANKMESNGLAGKVVVSEDTKRLLQSSSQDISSLFDFIDHKTVELHGINRVVDAFIVQSRETGTLGSNSSISGESEDDGLSDNFEEED
jgi:class 3 adenylate cyclase